jgi:hypothetical protein
MSQTEILAIWGAVTGTVGSIAGLLGLWLRFKQHGLDKASLVCEAEFGYDSPEWSKHKIIIRSIGRRPVTVDHIRYLIRPNKFLHKITRNHQHSKGRWLWDQNYKAKLTEGEKTETSISLHESIKITDIYKVKVIDQAGIEWDVKWPSERVLHKTATKSELKSASDENAKRAVSAVGYRLGERFYIQTKFDTKPQRMGKPNGRGFWLMDEKKYSNKIDDIINVQFEKFLSGETEEIT